MPNRAQFNEIRLSQIKSQFIDINPLLLMMIIMRHAKGVKERRQLCVVLIALKIGVKIVNTENY